MLAHDFPKPHDPGENGTATEQVSHVRRSSDVAAMHGGRESGNAGPLCFFFFFRLARRLVSAEHSCIYLFFCIGGDVSRKAVAIRLALTQSLHLVEWECEASNGLC